LPMCLVGVEMAVGLGGAIFKLMDALALAECLGEYLRARELAGFSFSLSFCPTKSLTRCCRPP
jgi:hypothetical protein